MARGIHRLTRQQVRRPKRRWLNDGNGLYLQQGRSWIFRYKIGGRTRMMGLGPLALVDLAQARELALAARRQLHQGIDPLQGRAAARAAVVRMMTFQQCADAYIAAHNASWRNAKHRDQWVATLATYAGPVIGKLSVDAIDHGLVMRVLEPIWKTKPETASRLRGRIEAVLDWAKVRGYRSGENPARWRGHLDKLLPAKGKLRKVKPLAALPYAELPAFMAKLRQEDGLAARALEFTILTAARTSEVLHATASEFDLASRTWTIPAARMKAEGRPRPSCPARRSRRRTHYDAAAGRERARLCAPPPGYAGNAQAYGLRAHLPRLSLNLPRLGGGDHRLSQSRGRASARPHHPERGRGRLPPRRSTRQTRSLDAQMGRLLLLAGAAPRHRHPTAGVSDHGFLF
jgi:integrase